MKHGPVYVYYSKVENSYYVCKADDEAVTQEEFDKIDLQIQISRGRNCLGSFIGSAENKTYWLEDMCETWTLSVSTLVTVAHKYPQTVYVGFCFCLQVEWQYGQRVVVDSAMYFINVEHAIGTELLPILLVIPSTEIDGNLHSLHAQ